MKLDNQSSIETPRSWWAVLFCALGLFATFTPIFTGTFPVLLKEIVPDLGGQRTDVTLGYAFTIAAMALGGPFSGRLIDRYGHQRILWVGVPLFGLVLCLFVLMPSSLLAYIILCTSIGAVASLTTNFVWYSFLPHWFDRRLGIALALAALGTAAGMIVMPIYAEWLLRSLTWREVYLVLGLTVIVIGLPNLLTIKKPPLQRDLKSSTPAEPLPGFEFKDVIRSPKFWCLGFSYLFLCMMINGNLVHLVPMLTDRGVAADAAARALSMLGAASILGRIGSGLILLRPGVNASKLGGIIFLLGTAGAFMLLQVDSMASVVLAVFIIGLALGVEGELLMFMGRKLFGMRAVSTVAGALSVFFAIGALSGPLIMSVGFDANNSYVLVQYYLIAAGHNCRAFALLYSLSSQ